ncbi:MAG: hypothetical protein M3P85_04865 [Actinomycetota bacterium]|nr:hypothetical protein [Actinomycetota bacterium]
MNLELGTGVGGGAHGVGQRARRRLRATAIAVVVVVASAAPAWADQVKVDPTAEGLSFGVKIQKMLNWGGQIALWASLASILAGAGAWGLSKHFGNYGGAHKGMQLVLGGAIGALVVASAGPIVNSMFAG